MTQNLKKKSVYTSLTKVLNIVLSFVVQFLITPIVLSGLGKELFGVYTIINKMQGYMSMVDLRPTAILKYKLASLQTSNDLIKKREYIGASIIISILLLPFMLFIGWLLSIGFDRFFIIEEEYVDVGRKAIIIISLFIGLKGFLGIPEAIIRGNNIEYKAFFTEPIRLIIYAVLVYVFLEQGFGLLGVISAIIIASLIEFIVKLILQNNYLPGFAPLLPSKLKVKEFFNKGSWYLGSSLFSQLLNTFDIMIIGVVFGVKEVTVYALSKAMLFRVSESISSVVGGMTSSIGHLIGENKKNELIVIREKLFRANLIIGITVMFYFIIFNKYFISLWVDSSNFIGEKSNLILCIAAFFTMLALIDEIFINSMQLFKIKSKIVLKSFLIFAVITLLLISSLGLIAIPISLAVSKIFQTISYQKVLQKHFAIDIKKEVVKNSSVIILIGVLLVFKYLFNTINIESWFLFLVYSFYYCVTVLVILFLLILTKEEQTYFKNLISKKK